MLSYTKTFELKKFSVSKINNIKFNQDFNWEQISKNRWHRKYESWFSFNLVREKLKEKAYLIKSKGLGLIKINKDTSI